MCWVERLRLMEIPWQQPEVNMLESMWKSTCLNHWFLFLSYLGVSKRWNMRDTILSALNVGSTGIKRTNAKRTLILLLPTLIPHRRLPIITPHRPGTTCLVFGWCRNTVNGSRSKAQAAETGTSVWNTNMNLGLPNDLGLWTRILLRLWPKSLRGLSCRPNPRRELWIQKTN